MYYVITKLSNLYARLFKGYFSQLLVFLILLFAFRPYDRGYFYMAIWQIFLVAVFVSAIFNCHHSKVIKITSACLAIPAIIFQWINLILPSIHMALAFVFCTVIFIFITMCSIIKQVVMNARVSIDTLKGVICAYFMVAFGFAFLYFFIGLLKNEAFFFARLEPSTVSYSYFLSELLYFSFATLLCIGYGDVIAIHDVSQTFAILEGIIGQFYIAILVSRLVAVYSFFEHKLHLISKSKK